MLKDLRHMINLRLIKRLRLLVLGPTSLMVLCPVFLLLVGVFSGCSSHNSGEGDGFSHLQVEQKKISLNGMGTVIVAEWLPSDSSSFAETQAQSVMSRMVERYDNTFSDWSEDSELRRLEQAGLAPASATKATPLFIEGLSYANTAFKETGGLFDITLGAVIWKERSRPVGMTSLEINMEDSRFRFGVNPVRLSFGGIVKGMLTGELAKIFLKNQITSFYISAGGGNEVFAGAYLKRLDLSNLESGLQPSSLVFVSNSHSLQGTRQHIFDPRDPKRAFDKEVHLGCLENKIEQLNQSGAMADVFSTALTIESFRIPEKYFCSQHLSLKGTAP